LINVKLVYGMSNTEWNTITSVKDLERIHEESFEYAVMILKHSTSCSVSYMALDNLNSEWNDSEICIKKKYILDLLSYRELSNMISRKYNIIHQSPQVIVLQNGSPIYENSHFGIKFKNLKNSVC